MMSVDLQLAFGPNPPDFTEAEIDRIREELTVGFVAAIRAAAARADAVEAMPDPARRTQEALTVGHLFRYALEREALTARLTPDEVTTMRLRLLRWRRRGLIHDHDEDGGK